MSNDSDFTARTFPFKAPPSEGIEAGRVDLPMRVLLSHEIVLL